jgi:putative ABC transport system permease protein
MALKKLLGKSVIVAKLFHESVIFAYSQLKGDKFRTFLSLFGVSVGIFTIVAIFTAIDALSDNVSKGLDSFGGDVIQISAWPMDPASEDDGTGNSGTNNGETEYKWWEYLRRPSPSLTDFRFISENSKLAGACAFSSMFSKTVKYDRNSVNNCSIGAVSYDWDKISNAALAEGRYFTREEMQTGKSYGIIGFEVSKKLFGEESPIGKRIKLDGMDVMIIGKYAKQGESIVNIFNSDEYLIIPYTFGRYFVNVDDSDLGIYVRPKVGVSQDDFAGELTQLMRAVRRIEPGVKNNFSINKMTFVLNAVQSTFASINIVGWIIAGFSLLIGGFGIANIMFVSVKERTNIIGIQKALGAKKYVILTQFLVESAFLSIVGGLVGVLLVAVVVLCIPKGAEFTIALSLGNIIKGLSIALVIGLISGMAPAYVAANLNPVDAINSK